MDAIGKPFNDEMQLDLSSSQISEIDELFRDYMREYNSPIDLTFVKTNNQLK